MQSTTVIARTPIDETHCLPIGCMLAQLPNKAMVTERMNVAVHALWYLTM